MYKHPAKVNFPNIKTVREVIRKRYAPLMQVYTPKNDKVELSPKMANIYKNQNPNNMHIFNLYSNIQQIKNFLAGVLRKSYAPLMHVYTQSN